MARLRCCLASAGLSFAAAGLLLAFVPGLAVAQETAEVAPSLYDRPVLVLDPGRHTNIIRTLDADREGRFLVTASQDKTVRVWSTQDGRLLRTLRLPAGPGDVGMAHAAAISPDGALIAAGGWTGTLETGFSIYLFDRASGQLLRRVGGLGDVISQLAFSPDGSRLVVAFWRDGVRLIDPTSGHIVMSDQDYAGPIYGTTFDPASGRLATTSLDGKVRLYDRDLHLLHAAEAPGGYEPIEIAFSPDGRRLAVGYDDSTAVDVLDGATLEPLFAADTTDVDNGDLAKVAWSADGSTLFAAGTWPTEGGSRLRRWPERGQGVPEDLPLPLARDTVMGLHSLPDGRLAFAAQDPRLGLLGADGHELWVVEPATAVFRGQYPILAVSADGSRVRFGYEYGGEVPALFSLAEWRLDLGGAAEGLALPRIEAPGLTISNKPTLNGARLPLKPYENARSSAVAPDGARFVLGADWTLYLLGSDGQELWQQDVPGVVWAVNVTPDGRLIVAAYGDGTIRWHKLEDGTELLAFLPLADRERWVAWTPDGYYASSPGTGSALGWHVNRGWDQAADFFPITAFPSYFQPKALPLVLQELDTARALGMAKMTQDRVLVQEAVKSAAPPGPQLHVLAVGVSEYANHGRLKLDFADDDARDIANALLGQEGGLYAKANVQYLTDAQATQRGFFAAMRVLSGDMQPGQQDVAVIHFSGHGAQVDGELYLLPSDVEADGLDAISTTGIEVRKLKELLRRLSERGKVLVLLDACHSGGVGEGEKEAGVLPDVDAVRAELAAAGTGVVVLTSSSGKEISRENPDWRNGAFTEAVLEALAGKGDRDGDHWLSVSELEGYVVRRVRELTGNQQNPRIAVVGEQAFEARLFVTGL